MNFADLHFIRPYWLLAFIPAIILFIFLLKNKLNQGNWSKVCDAELLPFILQEKAGHKNHWTLSAGTLASLLIILALAGPTWERLPSPVFRNSAALVIALDLSRSMDATDIKPSRLSKARFKIADILKQRKDGQTALLVYAGDAFTVTPLTEDTETIASQLSALTTDIVPSQGSNTVFALKKAIELLKQSGLPSGEILLITDGVADDSFDAVDLLAGYRLSILGIGTVEGAPIKIAQGGFVKDAKGNIVVPKLDSTELSRLANKGNGYYQEITSDDSDIETLLKKLDNPVEKEGEANDNLLIDQWNEKGPWLLLLVLPLAAYQFRKGLMSVALLCLLPFPKTSQALEWNDLWNTQNQQAEQAFKQNNYQQAIKQFDDPQWKAAAQYKAGMYQQAAEILQDEQSATGLYNLGNALAKSGKLAEALKAYDQSLQKQPENEDAKYNKEQVEKALEQQQKDQQQDENKDQSEQEDSQQDEKDKQDENSEQSDENKGSDENKSSEDQSDSESSEQQEKNEQPKSPPEPTEEEKQEQQKPEETKSQQTPEPSEYDESEQAEEQWLKRIPDDPAGLLKRKFKYQYGQRGRKNTSDKLY